MGYPVYDCDSRAKALMDNSNDIKTAIAAQISTAAIVNGGIDRTVLSEIVFADPAALATLNTIVHAAVREDLSRWVTEHDRYLTLFVETAILFQSHLNEDVDAEWRVEAPEGLRIERIMSRNHCTAAQAGARIAAQTYTPPPDAHKPPVSNIINDNLTPLLPQVLHFLHR